MFENNLRKTYFFFLPLFQICWSDAHNRQYTRWIKKRKSSCGFTHLWGCPCSFIGTHGTANPPVSPETGKQLRPRLPSFPTHPHISFQGILKSSGNICIKASFSYPTLRPTTLPGLISPTHPSWTFPGGDESQVKGEKEWEERATHSICRKFQHARIVLKSFSFKGTVWKFKWREKEGCIINRWGQPENSSPSLAWKLPSGEEIRIPPPYTPPFYFALHWSRSSRLSLSSFLSLFLYLSVYLPLLRVLVS